MLSMRTAPRMCNRAAHVATTQHGERAPHGRSRHSIRGLRRPSRPMMRHAPQLPPPSRVLLCASAAHCAQVLHAAAAAGVQLHGLHPARNGPAAMPTANCCLGPRPPMHPASRTSRRDRAALACADGARRPRLTIHMLYGSAAQQAGQLAPGQTPASRRCRRRQLTRRLPGVSGCIQ